MDAFDPVTEIGVRLKVVPSPLRAGRPVRWTFAITNGGGEIRVLTFASAQEGEVVLEAGGAERYRWSQGKLFAAVITEKELLPGEEWVYALEDLLAVEPGTYSLLATVTARPAPPPVRAEISVASARQ